MTGGLISGLVATQAWLLAQSRVFVKGRNPPGPRDTWSSHPQVWGWKRHL